jgi:hypothetical protein
MNFFVEYHGKNIVDGHFEVLSRWFSEGETVQNIHTIEDLLTFFCNKAHIQQNYTNLNTPLMEFDIYSRLDRRSQIQQLFIQDFRFYLCFVKVDDKVFASTLSTLNSIDYVEVTFKIKIVEDKHKTKYAPKRQLMDIDVPTVVGPKSRLVLLKRVELTHASTIAMEI